MAWLCLFAPLVFLFRQRENIEGPFSNSFIDYNIDQTFLLCVPERMLSIMQRQEEN